MPAYKDVLGRLVELPGVAQTHTYVVIEQVKHDDGLILSPPPNPTAQHHHRGSSLSHD